MADRRSWISPLANKTQSSLFMTGVLIIITYRGDKCIRWMYFIQMLFLWSIVLGETRGAPSESHKYLPVPVGWVGRRQVCGWDSSQPTTHHLVVSMYHRIYLMYTFHCRFLFYSTCLILTIEMTIKLKTARCDCNLSWQGLYSIFSIQLECWTQLTPPPLPEGKLNCPPSITDDIQ